MNYENIKKLLEKNKDKILILGAFILIFCIGYGSGRFVKKDQPNSLPNNYTINSKKKPFLPTEPAKAADDESTDIPKKLEVPGTATSTQPVCIVKGNISSAGKKIYHIKGGAFYARVKPEQCFNTEEEAKEAGYIKSSR